MFEGAQGDRSWDLFQPCKRPVTGLRFHFLKSIFIKSYQPFYFLSRAAFRDCWPAKAALFPIVQLSSQKRDCHSPRDTWQCPLIYQLPVWATPLKSFSVRRKGCEGFLKVKAKFHDLQKAANGKPALVICMEFVQILLERDLSSPPCF